MAMAPKKPLKQSQQKCNNCRFYVMMTCRRRSPVFAENSTFARWPLVESDAWCGQWEAVQWTREPQ